MDGWKATALVLAGILVGVVFAGPRMTGADDHKAKQFNECAVVWLPPPNRKDRIDAKKVPDGWNVVSGVGYGTSTGLVLCR